MTPVADLPGGRLYRVPDSGRFTLTAAGTTSVIAATHPDDNVYRLSVNAPIPGTLTARITDMPGWKATVDGRAVPVTHLPDDLMSFAVPAGTDTVKLTYLPNHLSTGLAVAVLGGLGLAGYALVASWRRRLSMGQPFEGHGEEPGPGGDAVVGGQGGDQGLIGG
jgi:hypothetical protein